MTIGHFLSFSKAGPRNLSIKGSTGNINGVFIHVSMVLSLSCLTLANGGLSLLGSSARLDFRGGEYWSGRRFSFTYAYRMCHNINLGCNDYIIVLRAAGTHTHTHRQS